MAGNRDEAMRIQMQLMPLHKHLFVESNPIPVKWAVERLGLCGGHMRLPLTTMSNANQAVVEQAMRDAGVL